MSFEEENKALVLRFWEELSKGNLEIWDEFCTSDYIYHGTAGDSTLEQAKNHAKSILAAFSNLDCIVSEIIVEGDYIANRYTIRCTHHRPYRGVSPTGKSIKYSGIEINRISNGKFVETWGISDTFGLLQQIGAIPTK